MTSTKPVIVIIPGGFHRPSHYDNLTNPLREKGYTVLTPPLVVAGDENVDREATPLSDVARIFEELEPLLDQGREAVLVSHSYGSVVAAESLKEHTVNDRKDRGLPGGIAAWVCIAGFAFPALGKNLMGGDDELPLLPYQTLKDGLLSLTEDAKPLFFNDVPPEIADQAWASICKFQSHKSLTSPPTFLASQGKCKKTYVLCEKDETVPPQFQEMMVGVGGFDKVVRVPAGHAPYLSVPELVVEAIEGSCS
ncbi:Alpha/beta hydrolase fold-1 [Plectosphaerella plurivora]|uniref:Alpha/beta hydrolase fold-1 n=1 Tax=Plectosphaerella plurivora TaxID=936078 RepID=A0A9P8V1B5_9PEZI|nr:Alpha/beta hydrolase fold-1 [Plectosphaerella plurivora]